MIECPRCGEPATIRKSEHGVEVECPKCHVSEYGETLDKAIRCFETPTEPETRK